MRSALAAAVSKKREDAGERTTSGTMSVGPDASNARSFMMRPILEGGGRGSD